MDEHNALAAELAPRLSSESSGRPGPVSAKVIFANDGMLVTVHIGSNVQKWITANAITKEDMSTVQLQS